MSETPETQPEQPQPEENVENPQVAENENDFKGKKRDKRDKKKYAKNRRGRKDKDKNTSKNEKGDDDDNDSKEEDGADNDDKDDKKQSKKDIFEEADESNGEKTLFFVHPDELWLKGKNQYFFVRTLIENITHQLKLSSLTTDLFRVSHQHDETFLSVTKGHEETVIDTLKHVFGINNFGRCFHIKRDVELLKKECFEKFSAFYNEHKSTIRNFRCECTRQDKQYELNSVEICKIVGEVVSEGLNLPAKMKEPDITIYVEVRKFFLYYFEKIDGCHGLPVNSSGRAVVLLSGGFDSPVAAWTVMRRGCSVRYVHFHSAPFGDWRGSITKVRKLVKTLSKWGGPLDFYCVPIGEQQRIIAKDAPAKLRVTLYRRLMFRIARRIADEAKCQALVTGDSLGQVASQTIESMTTIQSVIAPFLVVRPLIGKNKSSIMKKARKIGTHDLSILPAGDCCSHMLPKNPSTRPSIEEAEEGEKKLNIEEMVSSAIANMQKISINDPWNEGDDEGDEDAMTCPFDVK